MKPYVVYFKYKQPGDKKPGPIKHFRLYANSVEEARRLTAQYANYPNLEVLEVRRA